MKSRNSIKNDLFYMVVCLVAIVITLFFIITGAYIQDTYDLSIGSVSPKKFIASDAVENTVATQRLIDEAKASVSPLYTHNPQIKENVLNELNTFFEQTSNYLKTMPSNDADAYIFQNYEPSNGNGANGTVSSKVYLNQNQLQILKALNEDEFNTFKTQIVNVTTDALEQGIREDSDKSTAFIKEELSSLMLSEELTDLGYHIISSVIEPNLVVDYEATEKAREDKAAKVTPVMILKNQKIVDEGEIITEDIYEILEACGYIRNNVLADNLIPIIGISIFVLVSFGGIFYYIHTYHPKIVQNKKQVLLLLSLYIVLLIIVRFSSAFPFMIVPLLVFPYLTSLLLSPLLAVVTNMFAVIVCAFIYKGDLDFVLYFISTGTITAIVTNISDRNKLFLTGFFTALCNCIIVAGITLFFEKNWADIIFYNILYAFAGSILCMVLSIGSLPIWESIFGIVSSMKLLDLINPNKELLRRLLMEAPGTYHHSLIVANLAEAAAYDIGANPTLARVGAYYHDIGKLKYPQYFSENIVGENLHEYLDPYNSAKIIMSHIDEGIILADKYKLPQSVKDIILQHHGNTLVKFFYYKATKKYAQDAVKEKDFRYKNPIPQSKEAAVVMLADTAEAAVRSMVPSGKTMLEIEDFLRKLIKDKLDDGQLQDSQLSIKDLDTIVNSFMGIFKGMYHERVVYPDDNKNNKENNKEENNIKNNTEDSENNNDKKETEVK